MRKGQWLAGLVVVLITAAFAQAGVTSTFVTNSESWFPDGGGGNEPLLLGPDGNPGVFRVSGSGFPAIDNTTVFAGDLNVHVGPLEEAGANLLLSFDVKWVNADYPGAEFRIFSSGGTLWRKNVGNPALGVNVWDHIEEPINTNWTDTEAAAAGWIHAGGANTFAQTFANVTTFRIDFQGLAPGGMDSHFDNIGVNGFVPEPASLALVGLGGLAMLRRRRA